MNRRILIACVLGTVACILPSCGSSKGTYKVGQHTVVIIETSLGGGGSGKSTLQGADDQYDFFTYEGRNLRVRLENEVLTVNGKKHLIPQKDDSITIKNGYVEINGQPAKPVANK